MWRAFQALQPRSPDGLVGMGRLHEVRGDVRQAEAAFRAALDLDPQDYAAQVAWQVFSRAREARRKQVGARQTRKAEPKAKSKKKPRIDNVM